MAKEAYYFSHDCNARNDEKILAVRMRHGAEGYGIYFMILERLREGTDYKSIKDYNVIAFDLRVGADIVKSIIENFGLFEFTSDKKYFYSPSMNRRMQQVDDKRTILSEAGKKGNTKRWGDKKGGESPPDRHPIAIKGKEIKGKEIKLNNSIYVVFESLLKTYEEFISDQIFLEPLCMSHKLGIEEIKEYITKYFNKLTTEGTQEIELKEARRHFSNWLRKQVEGKEPKERICVYTSTLDGEKKGSFSKYQAELNRYGDQIIKFVRYEN